MTIKAQTDSEQGDFAAREAALDRINDDPAWAQRAYGVRDALPTAVGICPTPSHAVEFYFPLESAASVVRCPVAGCEQQLVVYARRRS